MKEAGVLMMMGFMLILLLILLFEILKAFWGWLFTFNPCQQVKAILEALDGEGWQLEKVFFGDDQSDQAHYFHIKRGAVCVDPHEAQVWFDGAKISDAWTYREQFAVSNKADEVVAKLFLWKLNPSERIGF